MRRWSSDQLGTQIMETAGRDRRLLTSAIGSVNPNLDFSVHPSANTLTHGRIIRRRTGDFKEHPLRTQESGPDGLVAGKDGNIWFTANFKGCVEKLDRAQSIHFSQAGSTTVTMATGSPRLSQGSSATVPFDRNGVTVTRRDERPEPRRINVSPP
jgi:streptogramin lyase